MLYHHWTGKHSEDNHNMQSLHDKDVRLVLVSCLFDTMPMKEKGMVDLLCLEDWEVRRPWI